MELKRPIKDNLCKTFRAAGLPKDRALPIVNEVEKWYKNNGVEWTVDRLKDLHNWYISSLAGVPNIPSWVSHYKSDPKGPFRCVFQMKNIGAALTILSCHTQFTNVQVSNTQLQKLEDGLSSKEVQCKIGGKSVNKHAPKLNFTSPTMECLTGVSIPAGSHVYRLSEGATLYEKAMAYKQSWMNLPGETAKFLRGAGLTQLAPEVLLDRAYRVPVGTLSCLQEPSLKARWISNPNRITQHFLIPLGREWGRQLEERFSKNDCTKDQLAGALWAQRKLRDGVKLASLDLSSATDKLNLVPCLDVLHRTYYGAELSQCKRSWEGKKIGNSYLSAVQHFLDVSRGDWLFRESVKRWSVGWPLGTRPSFPLLGTVNNVVASISCDKVGLDSEDSYRVLGDDLIIDARAADEYTKRISALGGVVNPTKSIVSTTAAEFAGFVITRNAVFPKRVNTRDLSDNSFMLVASTIGEQAKGCLRPRQLKVWNQLKLVPGDVVGSMYPLQQVGNEPLWLRYLWYLKHVQNSDKDIGMDSTFVDPVQGAVRMVMTLKEKLPELSSSEDTKWWIPRGAWEEIPKVPSPWEIQQISKTAVKNVESGDPRLVSGKTFLQAAEQILEKDKFIPYQTFKSETTAVTSCTPPEKSLSPGEASNQPVTNRKKRKSR